MLGYFDVCFIHHRRIRIFTKELISLEGTAPLVQQRMDVDANAATDPFVTISIDIIGVAAYFSVAKYFLEM